MDQIFEDIVETIHEPLLVLDSDLKVILSNRSFYEFFKVTPENTIGRFIYDLGNKQWDIPKLRELLETILPQNTTFDGYEIEHDFATIGRCQERCRIFQFKKAQDSFVIFTIRDLNPHKRLFAPTS